MKHEQSAKIFVLIAIIAAIGVPAAGWWKLSQGIVLHARMAETGGWTPEVLTVAAGEPLHLSLTSDDVTHSFAVGQSDQPPVDVVPGEMTKITLLFDQPGKYTFYCTRWCSLNHWRMRGTIEVTGPPVQIDDTVTPPLYLQLGLELDSDTRSDVIPGIMPSAARGAVLVNNYSLKSVISRYLIPDYFLAHSPVTLWRELRAEKKLQNLVDQDLWDLVAYIWRSNLEPASIQRGKSLYTANCAACHGETGAGDGVFADSLAPSTSLDHSESKPGETTTRPADFTDPGRMLAASPARLQGKILRGGMGTGMPYWGPIFTEDQIWDLVDYLWIFQFDLEEKP